MIFDVIWKKDIGNIFKTIHSKEDVRKLNIVLNDVIKNKINGKYQLLQKIRSYFRTHHNGKPLTPFQRDCMIQLASRLESELGYSCSVL